MSSLGFTSKEQRNLGLLVHLMTSNPKILYAPVGTEVDKVILKVRMHRLGPLSFFSHHPALQMDCVAGKRLTTRHRELPQAVGGGQVSP